MKRIAIVEDDRLFNEALYQTLKKADYAVDRAHSYGEGTALIDKQPDLFIVDVNLPAGDGFTLCGRLSCQTVSHGGAFETCGGDPAQEQRSESAIFLSGTCNGL